MNSKKLQIIRFIVLFGAFLFSSIPASQAGCFIDFTFHLSDQTNFSSILTKNKIREFRQVLTNTPINFDSQSFTPEEKLAVIFVKLEKFFDTEVDLNTINLQSIGDKLRMPEGRLSPYRTKNLVAELTPVILENRPIQEEFIKKITSQIIPDQVKNFSTRFVNSTEGMDFIEDLVTISLVSNPSKLDRLILKTSVAANKVFQSNFFPLARSMLINSFLVYVGFPPLHIPRLQLIQMVPNRFLVRSISPYRGQIAFEFYKSRLKIIRNLDFGQRSLYYAYYTGISIVGLYMLIEHKDLVLTMAKQSFLTEEDLKEYENQHYNPEIAQNDQYEAWLRSLDYVPSQEEKDFMLQMFKEQEEQGVLKVFD